MRRVTLDRTATLGLLHDIQTAVASDDASITGLLRKTKILAARLENDPLQRWVEHELNGYGAEDDLPDYRCLRDMEVRGDFSGPFQSRTSGDLVPPGCVAPEHRRSLYSVENREGVGAIDALVRSGEHSFRSPWPADIVVHYAENVYEGMSMLAAWRVVPLGAVIAIVDSVRNRLLDFTLELERTVSAIGEEDITPLAPPFAQAVTQIVQNTIIYGGQNVVAGSAVETDIQQTQVPPGWPALQDRLSELGIPDSEMGALLDAVSRDGGDGAETDSWLGRLAGKVGRGSLALAKGVTIEVVAAAIAKSLADS